MRAVLAHRDFRNLWIGQTLSGVGDSMLFVTVGLFVTDLTGSTAQVGLVLAAYATPLVVLLLFGGVLADRLPRRAIMIWSDGVRATVHVVLAVLIATHAVAIWQMVAIGVVFGSAEAFFRPAYTGLIPQTVPEELIQQAQSVTAVAREVAFLASPALATALVLGVSAAAAFAVDAATFVISIVFLLRVRARPRGEQAERSTVLTELREGWDAVRSRAWVWATVLAFSVALLTSLGPYFTLGATIAKDQYGEAAVFGVLQSAFGVGTFAGALVAGRWRPHRVMVAALLWALPWAVANLVFAVGLWAPLTFAVGAVAGFGLGLFGVWWETSLAQRIPPQLLSRVSAYDWMGSMALIPVGYVLSGVIGDAVGAGPTLAVGSAIAFAALALALLPRGTRELT